MIDISYYYNKYYYYNDNMGRIAKPVARQQVYKAPVIESAKMAADAGDLTTPIHVKCDEPCIQAELDQYYELTGDQLYNTDGSFVRCVCSRCKKTPIYSVVSVKLRVCIQNELLQAGKYNTLCLCDQCCESRVPKYDTPFQKHMVESIATSDCLKEAVESYPGLITVCTYRIDCECAKCDVHPDGCFCRQCKDNAEMEAAFKKLLITENRRLPSIPEEKDKVVYSKSGSTSDDSAYISGGSTPTEDYSDINKTY